MTLRHWTQAARTQEEAWSRNLTILLTTIFIEEIGWSLTAPFLPLYIRELGIGDPKEAALWAGVVMGTSLAISCAMTPVWAALADRFGSKLIVLRALVALAATNFAVGLVGNVEQILMVRLASAFFTGLVRVMANPVVLLFWIFLAVYFLSRDWVQDTCSPRGGAGLPWGGPAGGLRPAPASGRRDAPGSGFHRHEIAGIMAPIR